MQVETATRAKSTSEAPPKAATNAVKPNMEDPLQKLALRDPLSQGGAAAAVQKKEDPNASTEKKGPEEQGKKEENAPIRQQATSIDELYKQAEQADQELRAMTEKIASETGGTASFPPGLKGRERAEEKIRTEYGGDASQLMDISRSSIMFENIEGIYAAKEKIAGSATIVREKDRFKTPLPGGYRDILLNVKMSNGHICEIQLHSKQILEVKGGEGHKIYEELRGIKAKTVDENRPLSAEETKRIHELTAKSELIYGEAYEKFTKGSK